MYVWFSSIAFCILYSLLFFVPRGRIVVIDGFACMASLASLLQIGLKRADVVGFTRMHMGLTTLKRTKLWVVVVLLGWQVE
jgi:hypothetical protein